MSGLYNLMFGHNQLAPVLLDALSLTQAQTGRFRDAYLSDGMIVVYTRNGGSNRDDYEAQIVAMQAHPCYMKDADESHDETYASFYFKVPAVPSAALVELLRSNGSELDGWTLLEGIREQAPLHHVDQAELFQAALDEVHKTEVPTAVQHGPEIKE